LEYSEIAYKIINYILNLKSGQSVTISCEIHNVFDYNDPLAEIPFLEELAIVVRKNKGLPILDITTENLHKRFFEEISDDPPSISTELLNKWLDTSDMFIDLGWRSNPLFYRSIPERSFNKLNIFNKDFRKLFESRNKKLILIGFPTIGLAKYLDVDHAILKKTYHAALNVNYYDLKKRSAVLENLLKKHNNWSISTEGNILKTELVNGAQCFYGDMQNEHIIILPTGSLQQPILTSNLYGCYQCSQIYHDQYTWKNINLTFENGKVTSVDAEEQQKNMNLLKTLLFDDISSVTLQVGLNHSIKERSLYHLFDSVKYKNVSLVIGTKKGLTIALSENASIYHDKEKNILHEV
jgi:hypothetical protein